MKLAYAMLADSAQFTVDGRLWVLGGDIDTLYVPAVPAKHPLMTLVFKLLAAPEECEREHTLRIELTNPEGTVVTSGPEFNFVPHVPPDRPNEEVGVGMPILLQNQEFPMLGQYGYHIWVDSQDLRKLPLKVLQASLPASTLDVRLPEQREETNA